MISQNTMELMTIQETAALLKVSPVTIRRYIAARRLPAVRVGKGVRVRKEDVYDLPTPVEPKRPKSEAVPGKPVTKDDSLWNIVGLGHSDSATDVSTNKYKYLAEAYSTKK